MGDSRDWLSRPANKSLGCWGQTPWAWLSYPPGLQAGAHTTQSRANVAFRAGVAAWALLAFPWDVLPQSWCL